MPSLAHDFIEQVGAIGDDPIDTQIAGAPFAIHLAAYGTTPSDPTCGIIETYDGNKPLRFWIDHRPITLSRT